MTQRYGPTDKRPYLVRVDGKLVHTKLSPAQLRWAHAARAEGLSRDAIAAQLQIAYGSLSYVLAMEPLSKEEERHG